jgi:endo-1,4-beta-mannosidase
MNEAVNHYSDQNIIRNWYSEMADYFKSIDNNHLLSTGENGYDYHSHSYSDIDLFYSVRDGGGTPIKSAEGISTFGSSGGSVTVNRISDE